MKPFAYALLLLASLVTTQARAVEPPRYYVTMYAYENWRNAAAFSHSFAEFTEAHGSGAARTVVISWIPEDGHMCGLRPLRITLLGMHPGQNLGIAETIARAQQGGPLSRRDVYRFGPYEIRRELFEIAEARSAQLSSGAARCSGTSLILKDRRDSTPMCVAATDFFGDANPGLARGRAATLAVLESYRRHGFLLDNHPQAAAQMPAPAVAPPNRLPILGRLRKR